MITQNWSIDIDEKTFAVQYRFNKRKKQVMITINDDEFALNLKKLGFFKGKEEIFIIGDKQAILVIDKKGYADIVLDGIYVNSGKEY